MRQRYRERIGRVSGHRNFQIEQDFDHVLELQLLGTAIAHDRELHLRGGILGHRQLRLRGGATPDAA